VGSALNETSSEPALLRFPPVKSFVAVATDFVRVYCAAVAPDADTLSRIALVAHEMAENVVKYSAGGLCTMEVSIRVPKTPGSAIELSLTTKNRATPEQLEKAESYLVQLEKAENAERFYDKCIAESVTRDVGSGLGLARIRAEGLMQIGHEVAGADISITARVHLEDHDEAGK
jgi:hypothetical protein